MLCVIFVCVSCVCSACGGQKRATDLLHLELQVVVSHPMWVWGLTQVLCLQEQEVLPPSPALPLYKCPKHMEVISQYPCNLMHFVTEVAGINMEHVNSELRKRNGWASMTSQGL